MKFSLSWLNELLNSNFSVDELAPKLTMSGFEIEGIDHVGSYLSHVITARIETIQKHPNADKLTVTKCFDGKKYHQIVTGAPNIFEGAVIPLSLPGSTLANNLRIKKGSLRGIDSNGMLCSQKELGVSEEAEGIWILPDDTPLGVDFIEYGLLKDTLIDVSILPNRGDAQSLIGLAREISILFNCPFTLPAITLKPGKEKNPFTVEINDIDLCPKYTARYLQNIRIDQSPLWMQRRLQLSGIRPINNAVDITNYVLLECGQPLHAFDADLLTSRHIKVRRAYQNEKFATLDQTERTLTESMLLICDDQKAIALGGIMGGLNTEIQPTTQNILLESAYFHPGNIRQSEIKLGLRTESAIRFEKRGRL